jgi:phenylalanyl-tRNA synthetase beta chain
MIKSGGKSVALAGIMGGLETEVTQSTTSLLLESASFDPATVRRTAQRLGLRTDASARFEKSLDPLHTALGIQRFIYLARGMYPNLRLSSRLSDAFPKPFGRVVVAVNPRHVARTVGREVSLEEVKRLMIPLGFGLAMNDRGCQVTVPSWRATNDISFEADVIEEIMRRIGYDSLEPVLPQVTVRRLPPHALHELEQRTLTDFTAAHGFHEIHGYLWYDSAWIGRLGYEPGPCLELANPSAEGLQRLRRSLVPGLLAAVEKNRFHFPVFSLIEVGGVFDASRKQDQEERRVGLVMVRRGKQVEERLLTELKGAIEAWGWRRFARRVGYRQASVTGGRPWESARRTAEVLVHDIVVGRLGVIDLALRRAMDEHLVPWGIAWAEVSLDGLAELEPLTERLGAIPEFPLVELDFSILVPRTTQYGEIAQKWREMRHDLLKRVRYVGSYEGDKIPLDRRSLTFRTILGHGQRTLTEQDVAEFRAAMEKFLGACGYEVRK